MAKQTTRDLIINALKLLPDGVELEGLISDLAESGRSRNAILKSLKRLVASGLVRHGEYTAAGPPLYSLVKAPIDDANQQAEADHIAKEATQDALCEAGVCEHPEEEEKSPEVRGNIG